MTPSGQAIYTLSESSWGSDDDGVARLWLTDALYLETAELVERARAMLPAGVTDADRVRFGLDDPEQPSWDRLTVWRAARDGVSTAIWTAPEMARAAIADLAGLFRNADAAQQD